jgi:UDP-N-acetylmuramate--alanine ligase
MSALALVAKAWGAEVGGSDRARSPYVEALELAGVPVVVAHGAEHVPAEAEVVVSSAIASDNPELVHARTREQKIVSRGELLAELVASGPSIVVAGAHGKTTTAAMIAFALERLGNDPTYLIGGEVPQLGGNARAGAGWLVAEGDESDRSLELLRPEIAVLTNVDLDHHATFGSRAEVEDLFERWLERAPRVVRGAGVARSEVELAIPGEHNRRNAATAAAALELAGFDRAEALRHIAEFAGVGRRFERVATAGGVDIYDEYAHHPTEVQAALAGAREARAVARLLVLFQPHLFSRTRHLAREFASALAAADTVAVADVYPARELPVTGVTGKLVVDALAELRPGFPLAWTPQLEDGVRFLASRARSGDVALMIGAGDVQRAAPLLAEELG